MGMGEMEGGSVARAADNSLGFERLVKANPVVLDVKPAIHVVPGFERNIVLTAGPTLPCKLYQGGQREAIIGGARFEGLACSRDDAIAKLDSGEIRVAGGHD